MLENETESIIQTLTEHSIGSARSLALKDALGSAMPRSIKQYLRSEVAYTMQEDLRSAGSKLPLSSPVVHKLVRAYTSDLALECILTREEYTALLDNGVHFVENYLCRPQWTLEQFVFDRGPRVTFPEVQRKFGYVTEY